MLLKTTVVTENIILCYNQEKLSIKFVKKVQEKIFFCKAPLRSENPGRVKGLE